MLGTGGSWPGYGDAMDSPVSVAETAAPAEDLRLRSRTVVRWAVGVSWVWLAPLTGVAVVAAYLSFIFVSFTAEALGGEVKPSVIVLVLALPALSLLLAAVVGFGTAFVMARWMSGRTALLPLPSWFTGVIAAALGGAAAVSLFWTAMSVTGLGSSS